MKNHQWAAIGCFFAGSAVALGAFAAHAFKSQLSEYALSIFETGVQYQFFHGLALISLGYWQSRGPSRLLKAASAFLVFGILFFSGSLYALAFTSWTWLWPITPLGGMSFLVGWSLAGFSLWRMKN